jgi:hypothetical protein
MREPKKSDKLLLAGASLPVTEAVMAAHWGVVGGIVALGLSGLVYVVADELEARGRGITLPRPTRRARRPVEQGFLYKAFHGKSVRGEDREDDGLWVPPQFVLDEVLEFIDDANGEHSIYFGESEDGSVAIPLSKMYHVMDVSSSGAGKSNRLRLAMMQMVNHCRCYYINPIAAPVKAVEDDRKIEVWQPIFDRLANKRPVKDGVEIEDLLKKLVREIKRRNAAEEQGDFSWVRKPIFVFVDELPEVFALCAKAIEYLDKIGRMGRNYCVFCWVAGQTALVEEIGQSTAAQANYKTRIYGGGDQTSANRLMKGGITDSMERALTSSGEGLSLMLADGLSQLPFVRAPLVTNEGMFEYLELGEFRMKDWIKSSKVTRGRTEDDEDFYASTLSQDDERDARSVDTEPRETVKHSVKRERRERVKGLNEEDILTAIEALEEQGHPLTLNAVARLAGLTWRQYSEIEDVAFYCGYDLERGKGRPAKEAERNMQ